MEAFYRTHAYLVEHTNAPVRRDLMDEIDWNDRLIGIKGTRGVGKTTFLLQYAKEKFGTDRSCLFINMNNFYFSGHGIVEFAAEFQRLGLVVKRALHDHKIGVERVQDRIEPVHGHRPVHRCVAAAGVYRAEKYGRGVCVAPAHDGDGRLASAAQLCRRCADDARLAPHVGKGHRAVLVKKGGLVRTGCGGGFQPVEHVCIHACSSFLLSIHNRQLSYHVSPLKTSKIGTVLRKR